MALLSPNYSKNLCFVPWGSRCDPQSMGPPRLPLFWGKTLKNCGGLLGGCQSLKAAAEHCSWDKDAFFPLKGCCSPYSWFLWQLLMPGAKALVVPISSSPTGSQMGDSEAPKVTQDGISKALTPSRATFSINSSVSILWQSFRLIEKVWG